MPRLIHPTAGTVVTAGDSLSGRYRATGWTDADAPVQQEQAPSEKPKPVVRRKSSK